jgi:drug/metabolite transporter (DMT)-like permease
MAAEAAPEAARREALTADLALVFVTALWGSTFVVNHIVLETAPPLGFLTLRFGIAGLALAAFAWKRPRTDGVLGDSLLIGFLLALGIGMQITGQLFTTASKAAFVTGLSVPLTPVVELLVTRKLPSRENLLGLLVAVAGFTLMTFPKDARGVNAGDLLILGTAVVYAVIIFLVSQAAPKHDVRLFAAGQIACAGVFVGLGRLALTPFLGQGNAFLVAEARAIPFTPRIVLAVAWMVVMATIVTFLVQTWAQARMSATHAAILYALEPVFTALFAAALLSERMSGRELLGGALVLLGIVLSELRLRFPLWDV